MQLPSNNVIIYGHHMKNASMFCELEKFKSQDFWREHKTISFSTVTDRYEYEIVSVFKTFVYSYSPDSFKYYHFVNAETPEDFSAFADKCKELSLYETGVSAEYGDKLITLLPVNIPAQTEGLLWCKENFRLSGSEKARKRR